MPLINTLESHYYTDPLVFARERERIFKPAWWLLGPAHLLQKKGSYVSDTVCGWSVFVVRGQDGELRGFHNICRHRGARLLDQGEGQCRVIKCPYHAWGFDTAGKLVATPGFGAEALLKKEDYSLFSIRVHQWRGMVFICVDPEAPPFSDWVGSLDTLMSEFPGSEDMQYHGSFTVTGQANWKTYCDNTVEGYHLHAVHPRLASAVRSGTVEIKPYDNGQLVAFHVDYGAEGDGSSLRGNLGLWAYKYPGFQIAISANAFKVERVEPTGIDSLLSTNWAWYSNLEKDAIDDSFAWSETVVQEDIGICEKVQLNLGSGIYQQGPLSPDQETNVALFQGLVRDALKLDV